MSRQSHGPLVANPQSDPFSYSPSLDSSNLLGSPRLRKLAIKYSSEVGRGAASPGSSLDQMQLTLKVTRDSAGQNFVSAAEIGDAGLKIYDPGLMFTTPFPSKICFVDGANGRLFYYGGSIQDVVGKYSALDVAELLSTGTVSSKESPSNFRAALERTAAVSIDTILERIPSSPNLSRFPLKVYAAAIVELGGIAAENNLDKTEQAALIIAHSTKLTASILAARRGLELGASHTESYLGADLIRQTLSGLNDITKTESAMAHQTMELIYKLLATHGTPASVTAELVVTSTGATIDGAVAAGLLALEGPKHGGAAPDVMNKVDEIAKFINAGMEPKEAAEKVLENIKLVPGFGHRVYKEFDPRAKLFGAQVKDLFEAGFIGTVTYQAWLAFQEVGGIKTNTKPGVKPNVDIAWPVAAKGSMGLEASEMSLIFGWARTAGLVAAHLEYDGKIIRPPTFVTGVAIPAVT